MNICDLNEIYEMLKNTGYLKNNDDSSSNEPEIDPTGGGASNCCANLNLDIPCGFQDINPIVFITIGDVIGNILAGNLPFNMAVAVSNWLNLVGQAIETYGAQQQYFQNGPGRLYDPRYKNVNNPYCSCKNNSNETANENTNSTAETNEEEEPEDTSKNNYSDDMKKLEETVEVLKEEVNKYKEKIECLEQRFNEIKSNSKNL